MPPKKKTRINKRNVPVNLTSGKFVGRDGMTSLERWNKPGPYYGFAFPFAHWLNEIKPKILTSKNVYKRFVPTLQQAKIIKRMLSADSKGNFKHTLSLLIEPRRHGKSTIFALIVLWLTTSRNNHVTQLLGNTELHSKRVQFRTLKRIIENTAKLRLLIPEKHIHVNEIYCPVRKSLIQTMGVSTSMSFGDKLDCLWTSDFHACPDLEPWNALQASLLDSENSLSLIDSNVDHTDGHVHGLQRQAKTDKTIFCDHVQYKNLDDYLKNAPAWIDRAKAKRLQSTVLPTDFARDILGKRSDARNALFPASVISLCKTKYKTPVADINELTKGRSYKVGAGLDRSKSLFGGDNTVWSTILKVASPEHGEPEIYLLNQEVIIPNTSRMIKKAILKDHERYRLDNVVLENYEVTDLAPWLDDQKIPFELVSAHDTNQNASFPEFYRICKEGRFHYPETLKGLTSEMQTFVYTQRTGGKYSFGHASQKFKDDRVYSVNWSIFSLRSVIMNLYTLGNIACTNKSKRRLACFLFGGGLQLLCSEQCQAFKEVESMFQEYKRFNLDSEITIPEFYERKVKLTGAKIYQAA